MGKLNIYGILAQKSGLFPNLRFCVREAGIPDIEYIIMQRILYGVYAYAYEMVIIAIDTNK
jgi:hypothetical protein